MPVEGNKALAHRFAEDVFNKRNLSLIDELVDANCVTHTTAGDFKGPAGFRQFVGPYLEAFPDVRETTEEGIAEGDRVMLRQTIAGTHQGGLMGIPPTGKKMKIQHMVVFRFARGKVAESWALADLLGMMQQLGLMPPMGQK